MNQTGEVKSRKGKLIAIVLAAVLLVGGALYVIVKNSVENKVRAKLDAQIEKAGDDLFIKYEDVEFSPFSFKVVISELSIEPKGMLSAITGGGMKLLLDNITVSQFDKEHEIPHSFNVALNGLHLGLSSELKEIRGVKRTMKEVEEFGFGGLEDIKFNLALDYDYSKETKQLDIENFKIEGQNMGRLDMSLSLKDMPLIDLPPMPKTERELKEFKRKLEKSVVEKQKDIENIKLKEFKVSYDDKSLVPVVLEKMIGMSDSKKERSVKKLEEALKEVESDMERKLIEAFIDLLTENEFKLVYEPKEPKTLIGLFEESTAFKGQREKAKQRALEASCRGSVTEVQGALDDRVAGKAMIFMDATGALTCYDYISAAARNTCVNMYPDLTELGTAYSNWADVIDILVTHHNDGKNEVSPFNGNPLFTTDTTAIGHVIIQGVDETRAKIYAFAGSSNAKFLIFNATVASY